MVVQEPSIIIEGLFGGIGVLHGMVETPPCNWDIEKILATDGDGAWVNWIVLEIEINCSLNGEILLSALDSHLNIGGVCIINTPELQYWDGVRIFE